MNATLCYIVLGYLVFVNVLTFVMYGVDKYKARHDRWRVKEATLLWMAVAGGSIGAWLGIRVWHHKTLHNKFRYGIPLILFAQLAALILIVMYRNGLIVTNIST